MGVLWTITGLGNGELIHHALGQNAKEMLSFLTVDEEVGRTVTLSSKGN